MCMRACTRQLQERKNQARSKKEPHKNAYLGDIFLRTVPNHSSTINMLGLLK